MTKLLHIDSAGEKAFVALSENDKLIALAENEQTNTHAEFIQVAIDQLFLKAGWTLSQIDAIVVNMGPGSYTGIRVGLASAKGLAYALDKPLIGLSSLDLLYQKAIKLIDPNLISFRIFSMIDARRMEVFGAIYDEKGIQLIPAQAIILDLDYVQKLGTEKTAIFCIGSGANKILRFSSNELLHCIETSYTVLESIELGICKFNQSQFETVAYSSPLYIKEVYIPAPKSC